MKNLVFQTEGASRPRWMIVDDNKDILSVLREIIAEFVEADVQCFHSPHAALATFASAPEAVDFVITDLEMPGMSGLELGERLRKLSPSLKILLATGSDILTDGEAAQKGFCGLLHKPFPFAELRNALASAGILKTPVENKSKNFQALTAA
jgi:two-component system, cell cycle sensor histidine kinase and response regulator CckA